MFFAIDHLSSKGVSQIHLLSNQGVVVLPFLFLLLHPHIVWALQDVSSSPSIAGGAQFTIPLWTTPFTFGDFVEQSSETLFRFLASTTGSVLIS